MTDKVQKIRKEVEKRYEYWKEKESNSHSIESEIRMSECQHLLLMLDSLQEEPVNENLEEVSDKMMPNKYCWSGDGETTLYTREQMKDYFKAGAQWQKEKK